MESDAPHSRDPQIRINTGTGGDKMDSQLTRHLSIYSLNDDRATIKTEISFPTTYSRLRAMLELPKDFILLAQRQIRHPVFGPDPFWTIPNDDETIPEYLSTLYTVNHKKEKYYIALVRTPDTDFPVLISLPHHDNGKNPTVQDLVEQALQPKGLNVVSVTYHGYEGRLDMKKPPSLGIIDRIPRLPTAFMVKTAENSVYKLNKNTARDINTTLTPISWNASKLADLALQCKFLRLQSKFLADIVNHLVFGLGNAMASQKGTSKHMFIHLFQMNEIIDRMKTIFLELASSTRVQENEHNLMDLYFNLCRNGCGVVAVREAYNQFLILQRSDQIEYLSRRSLKSDTEPSQERQNRNFISLDGLGPLGYSELIMIEDIMNKIQIEGEPPRPCDHFDIIAGSGMGGIIAILLGRLKMRTKDAKTVYERISRQIYPESGSERSKDMMQPYDDNFKGFESEFREALRNYGLDAELPILDPEQKRDKGGCKTLLFSLDPRTMAPYRIRSYEIRSELPPTCTILEAARATLLLSQKSVVDDIKGQEFLASYRFNNPTRGLLDEATKLYPESDEVGCIISLGARRNEIPTTSETPLSYKSITMLNTVGNDSENTHHEVESWLDERHIYFRFNPEYGDHTLPLDEWGNTGALTSGTHQYLSIITKEVDEAVKVLKTKSGDLKIKYIKRVPAEEIGPIPHPPLIENFFGRDTVLDDLLNRHTLPTLRHFISVLVGLSGCGKTQIGLRFWERLKRIYPEILFLFLDAKSEENIQSGLQKFIRSRSPYKTTYKDALQWLATTTDKWLVMFDGADDPDIDLVPYIPEREGGHILITSRNTKLGSVFPDSVQYIGDLPQDACVELLLLDAQLPRSERNKSDAREIASKLGYHAHAMSHAAAYILSNEDVELSDYLSNLGNRRQRLLSRGPKQSHYDVPVYTAFDECYQKLPAKLQKIMAVFSHLDCSQISQDMIVHAAKNSFLAHRQCLEEIPEEEDLKICVAASVLGELFCPSAEWDVPDLEQLIRPALQCSLLMLCKAKNEHPILYMHSLVQAYIHDRHTDQKEHLQKLAARLIVSGYDNSQLITPAVVIHNQLINPHAKIIPVKVDIPMRDRFCLVSILRRIDVIPLAIHHLNSMVDTTGKDLALASKVKGELARAFSAAGQYTEAHKHLKEALEIRERIFGKGHILAIRLRLTMGSIYVDEGKYREAADVYEQELSNVIRVTGECSPISRETRSRLAILRVPGSFEYSKGINNLSAGPHGEDEELFTKSMEIRIKTPGDRHADVASTIALAIHLKKKGDVKAAEENFSHGLSEAVQILGTYHPYTVLLRKTLLNLYMEQSRSFEAEVIVQASISVEEL